MFVFVTGIFPIFNRFPVANSLYPASPFRRNNGISLMELRRNLRTDTVAQLEPTPVRSLTPGAPVREAIHLMQKEKVGCILICEGNRPVGIFTEKDMLQRILGNRQSLDTPLAECMTADVVTVLRRDTIRTAIKHMNKGGYRHLPVVDESGQAVGILSVKRIIHYLVEHFPNAVYNLPPDPKSVPETREGA